MPAPSAAFQHYAPLYFEDQYGPVEHICLLSGQNDIGLVIDSVPTTHITTFAMWTLFCDKKDGSVPGFYHSAVVAPPAGYVPGGFAQFGTPTSIPQDPLLPCAITPHLDQDSPLYNAVGVVFMW